MIKTYIAEFISKLLNENKTSRKKSNATSKTSIRKGSTVTMKRREELKFDKKNSSTKHSDSKHLSDSQSKNSNLLNNWENMIK